MKPKEFLKPLKSNKFVLKEYLSIKKANDMIAPLQILDKNNKLVGFWNYTEADWAGVIK